MHQLNRAADDGGASPIDPSYPGRYIIDPPCRKDGELNPIPETPIKHMETAYQFTGRWVLPEDLACTHCILQIHHSEQNNCFVLAECVSSRAVFGCSVPQGCVRFFLARMSVLYSPMFLAERKPTLNSFVRVSFLSPRNHPPPTLPAPRSKASKYFEPFLPLNERPSLILDGLPLQRASIPNVSFSVCRA